MPAHPRVRRRDAPLLLEHAHVGLGKVWLRRRPRHRRHGRRHGHLRAVVRHHGAWVVSLLERLERHELRELAAEDLGVAAEAVNHAMRRLLVLGEVSDVDEAARVGRRVHEEEGRCGELDDNAAPVWVAVAVVKLDVLDVRERVLDLVASLVVVDVVGHG